MAQQVKNPHATQEMRVPSPGQEDPLEQGRATHFNILACRIPRTEEPGGLQSMGSQRVRRAWSGWACTWRWKVSTSKEQSTKLMCCYTSEGTILGLLDGPQIIPGLETLSLPTTGTDPGWNLSVCAFSLCGWHLPSWFAECAAAWRWSITATVAAAEPGSVTSSTEAPLVFRGNRGQNEELSQGENYHKTLIRHQLCYPRALHRTGALGCLSGLSPCEKDL